MATKKITALTALGATPADADIMPMVDDPGGTPVTKKLTFANLFSGTRVPDQTQAVYVSKAGNDSNDGSTPAKATLTIGAAITIANARTPSINNQQMIWVLDSGRYSENIVLASTVHLYAPGAEIIGDLNIAGLSFAVINKMSVTSTTPAIEMTQASSTATVQVSTLSLAAGVNGVECANSAEIDVFFQRVVTAGNTASFVNNTGTGVIRVKGQVVDIGHTGWSILKNTNASGKVYADIDLMNDTGGDAIGCNVDAGEMWCYNTHNNCNKPWDIESGATLNYCGLDDENAGDNAGNFVSTPNGNLGTTDNAICRSDGTSQERIQGSPATIDDSGTIDIPSGQTYKINAGSVVDQDVTSASTPTFTGTNFTGIPDGGLTLTDVTTNDSSTSKHGFLKKLDNVSTNFMNGQGNWAAPAGGSVTTSTLTDAATITVDLDSKTFRQDTVTITDNRTMGAASNQVNGGRYVFIIKQDAGGTNTLAWNANYLFSGGSDPVVDAGANAITIVTFVSDGTNMFCVGTSLGLA